MKPTHDYVIVTGAAGAIGSATVHAFLSSGFGVVGLDRSPDVHSMNGGAYQGLQVDLQDERGLAQAIEAVRRRGALRHVVSIAGGALPGEPETAQDPFSVDATLFRNSLDANLVTQFLLVKHSLPWLRENDGDRSVTFTSSFNALTGCGMPAYSAAKAGLIGMMHAVAGELGAEGIRINVVAPGTIRTPRTERLWAHVPDHFEHLEKTSALGRLGRPEDVARTFVALTTLLTHVTGQVLVVDGGQMGHALKSRTRSRPAAFREKAA
jgi:NAD(P)-dependent dehydrogenase (short-subunit alcohol dehydrogenase family)